MSVLMRPGLLHDLLTRATAVLSAFCIAAITILYCSEILARYFLHRPTSWTAAVAVYLMLATATLIMPYLVMKKSHVAITLSDYLPTSIARTLAIFILAAACVVCCLSAYITLEETIRAFDRGVRTTDTLFIPKWWLLVLVVYGITSSAVHFARQLLVLVFEGIPSSEKSPSSEISGA